MATASESQGLKIAVALLITVTVILLVSSYFLYSNAQTAEARLASETEKRGTAEKAQSLAVTQYSEMRRRIGTKAEEFELEARGRNHRPRQENRRDQAQQSHQRRQYRRVPDCPGRRSRRGRSWKRPSKPFRRRSPRFRRRAEQELHPGSLDPRADRADGEHGRLLTTQVSLNYVNVRQSLEGATAVGKQQVDVQAKAAADSQADLLNEQKKHVDDRQTLLTKVDQLQNESDKRATDVLNLTSQKKQMEDDFNRQADVLDDDAPRGNATSSSRSRENSSCGSPRWARHLCRLRDRGSPGEPYAPHGCSTPDEG